MGVLIQVPRGVPIQVAAFSLDGKLVASTSDENIVKLWELHVQAVRVMEKTAMGIPPQSCVRPEVCKAVLQMLLFRCFGRNQGPSSSCEVSTLWHRSDALCPLHRRVVICPIMFAFSFQFLGISFYGDAVLVAMVACLEVGQGIFRDTV